MDFTTLAEFFSAQAFPVAMSIVLLFTMLKNNDSHKAEIKAITDDFAKALEKNNETIQNNTIAITKLSERMGVRNFEA